ncbi:MAG: hypothetical protein QXT19_01170 [Candidatus Woesearchaeota archaeon]
MSIDEIAMQLAPRRRIQAINDGERSILSPYITGKDCKLRFGAIWAQPRSYEQLLYAKAFKEAVNKAAGSNIGVAQLRTPPYELCISAKNLATRREIRLYASVLANPQLYSVSLQKVDGESSQFIRSLKANNYKKLMAQYKEIRESLYKHLASK